MSVKATGAELKAFYSDKTFWPDPGKSVNDHTWHEDEEILVDGVALDPDADIMGVADDAKAVIAGGVVRGPKWGDSEGPSFEAYFKKWRRRQGTAILVISVPKDRESALRSLLSEFGAKVS